MRHKPLLLALYLTVLAACGDESPDCAIPGMCGMAEAGIGAMVDAAGSGSIHDAAATAIDAAPPVPTPTLDAGPSSAPDASRPDAAPMPTGEAGTTPMPTQGSKPSTGCGMPAPMSGKTTIDVMGTAREYILTLPQNYDPTKPYKLIFAWHGLGGTADQIARTYYGLQSRAQNSAIFVAGQGLNTSNQVGSGPGWDNMGGRDVAFVKALYARLQTSLCIDENRVFSTGMSYGGIMSNTLGCQMGDVFRAIAPMSGSGPGYGGRATCVGEVAVWMSHGDNDTVVPTASGMTSRDFWVKANKCQQTTMPVDPSPCVAYAGCAPDLPVTFCLFPGGHTIPTFAGAAIWTFFSQF